MDKKDVYLIVAAIIICVIICVLSPYIASGDPDGLEKSAEDSGLAEDFSIEEILSFLIKQIVENGKYANIFVKKNLYLLFFLLWIKGKRIN